MVLGSKVIWELITSITLAWISYLRKRGISSTFFILVIVVPSFPFLVFQIKIKGKQYQVFARNSVEVEVCLMINVNTSLYRGMVLFG